MSETIGPVDFIDKLGTYDLKSFILFFNVRPTDEQKRRVVEKVREIDRDFHRQDDDPGYYHAYVTPDGFYFGGDEETVYPWEGESER